MKEMQEEKQKVKLRGQLRLYMQWPAVMAVLLFALNIWIYWVDRSAGILMFIFVAIYIIVTGVLYLYSKALIIV